MSDGNGTKQKKKKDYFIRKKMGSSRDKKKKKTETQYEVFWYWGEEKKEEDKSLNIFEKRRKGIRGMRYKILVITKEMRRHDYKNKEENITLMEEENKENNKLGRAGG